MNNIKLLLTLITALLSLNALSQEVKNEPTEVKRVSSKSVQDIVFFPEFSAPANVLSLNESQISALISAQILSMNVLVGDTVSKGATMVSLDCQDAELVKTSALARLRLAQKEVNRLSKLKKASAVTEQNLNSAETDLSLARVTHNQTRLQVTRCTVAAPFRGVVTARQAANGELAAPGTPLLSLTDLENLEVSAQIPLSKSTSLQQADQLKFVWSGKKYPLNIRHLSRVINPLNRNRELRLTFAKQKALPGAAGRLVWQSRTPHIPADMLLERGGIVGIFIVESNEARFVELRGAIIGHPAAVDLPDDTRIILDGRYGLIDGDTIDNRGL